MLGFITRAVFGLEIVEKNGIVRISGIRADQFIDDINKTFGTTRVTVNMLNKATRSYIEFYSFFSSASYRACKIYFHILLHLSVFIRLVK